MTSTTFEARLEQQRRLGSPDFWASRYDHTGHDASGALSVTVDPSNRVSVITVHDVPYELRTAAGLARAVDRAFRQATMKRVLASLEASRHPVGRRSTPRGDEQSRRQPVATVGPGQQPTREVFTARTAVPALDPRARGRSNNECVAVTLDPAGSNGTVEADPGWLAHTTRQALSTALTEAFRAAYEERDR